MSGRGERLGGEPSTHRAVILLSAPAQRRRSLCGVCFLSLPFYGQFLRGGACGGADYGYVGAFGPAGGVDGGGVALAVLRQHPAAVEVVDLQAEECEGGEDLNPVTGGVGVGVLFILSARISVRRWC